MSTKESGKFTNQEIPDPRLGKIVDFVKDVSKPVDGLLVPVSGGTDSALTFWICTQAVPGKVLGVYAGEDLRGKEWFESRGKIVRVETPGEEREVEEMRWARFLSMSKIRDFALVGSRTKTEDLLGTYSLASRVATVLPIVGVWKSDVMDLCEKAGVPEDIIASSYQFDCDCGRPERLYQIPFPTIDAFLKHKQGENVNLASFLEEDDYKYLDRLVSSNAFRSDLPYQGPKV